MNPNGTNKMRTLERFFHRRKISNTNAWLKNMGITNKIQLVEWCNNNDIIAPSDEDLIMKHFVIVDNSQTKTSITAPLASDNAADSWHTPAADRPRKPVPKKKATTKAKSKRQIKK